MITSGKERRAPRIPAPPSPFKRQSRRIFQVFMRAKACSARARTWQWEVLCSFFQAGSSFCPRSAVRDNQAGVPVAAVSDHGGAADGVLRSGQFPRLAVVAVAGQQPADHDDKPGVGVDDDLVIGGVPSTSTARPPCGRGRGPGCRPR